MGQSPRGKLDPNRICNYCFGKGHWRNECPVLRKKIKPGYLPAKPSGAAASLRAEESCRVIATVQAYTKLESVIKLLVVEQEQTQFAANEEIDPCYPAFVSDGFVSLAGSERKVPVKILRDSGTLDSVLPFSQTDTGSSVDVHGMGLTVFSALRHKL